jgi:hypothetical protein
MRLEDTHSVDLSGFDLMTLRAALRGYLRAFEEHRGLDDEFTHPDDEWQRLQRQVGELIWRLEDVGVPSGATVIHSAEAVDSIDDPSR